MLRSQGRTRKGTYGSDHSGAPELGVYNLFVGILRPLKKDKVLERYYEESEKSTYRRGNF